MLNPRVADLDDLLAQLHADGVTVDEEVERSEHGVFGWCVDGEGNRVELWQPRRKERTARELLSGSPGLRQPSGGAATPSRNRC